MNSENSKISDPHRLVHNFLDKIDLNKSHKILAFTIHGKILKKNLKKTKKWKIKKSTPTRNEKFELSDRSYSVSYIQDYFEHILKKCQEMPDNP